MLSIREKSDWESGNEVLSSDRSTVNFKLRLKKTLYNKMIYKGKSKQTAIQRALETEENKPV